MSNLLQTLYTQSYSQTDFEIICVDDQSSDESVSIVEGFSKRHHNIKLLRLPPHLTGKKHAIACGVAASCFELIATTDADCIMPERWLEWINAHFTSKVNLLVGAVKIEYSNDFFSKLQAMEFA
ncbi:MAG: glycosyltransferase, partial [Flammeovirgaceae bacterium]